MLKIAITGNIASGKSQVENIIKKYFPVYDSDKIAHNILNQIDYFYGYDVFSNGKIDRKKLGDLVFHNNDLKKKLESIIHPKVKEEILKIFKSDSDIVFISVPLLFETGFNELFDKVIFVKADNKIRLQRLMKRNKLSEKEAILRIKAQDQQENKIQKSDYIIENNSTIDELQSNVLVIIRELSRFMQFK